MSQVWVIGARIIGGFSFGTGRKQLGGFMIPVNEAQQKLQDLIDSVTVSHEPIIIEGCDGNAVLLSQGDWKSVQETLYLLSIPGMRESIREGLATPVEECAEELEW
nr:MULTISPECIES: type II toxin-antitoxin system Phd/YefM family antitoxin [unclassified Microcystis]